jgi:hypothetical protein
LGRFLSDIDWQIVKSARSCEEKTNLFTSLISTGLDIIMPAKQVKSLIDMLHNWTKATDGNGGSIRVVLFDYRKALDLIDHRLLAEKILLLPIPNSVKNWVLDFLMDREQRVKLSNDCLSEWGSVPSGVPQGTKLGMWLFILMINDLRPTTAQNWKYIDNTTISETKPRNGSSNIQHAANEVQSWSVANRLQLNRSKCKELLIYFGKTDINFQESMFIMKTLNWLPVRKSLILPLETILNGMTTLRT